MYQVKINEDIMLETEVSIGPGEEMIDENGQTIMDVQLDANGDPVLDANGDPVMEAVLNDTADRYWTVAVKKTEAEIAAEKQALIDAKTAEINAKMAAYEAGKQNQIQNGGPAPVADFEIKKICNEHNCEFEVIWDE